MRGGASAWLALAPLLAACSGPPDEARKDDEASAAHGRVLLARYHCGSCHSIPNVPASQGKLAVSLDAYGKRSYIAGRVANEPATLARWIVDPASIVPGTLMPNLGVSPDDARSMALYLGRLK